MGVLGKQDDDGGGGGGGGGNRGLNLELNELACADCARQLHPWERSCPACGGAGVRREDIQPIDDPLLARLMGEIDEPGDALDEG